MSYKRARLHSEIIRKRWAHRRTSRLSAKAASEREGGLRRTLKIADEAIGIFLHHWKHGGISRQGFFHQQTASAMIQASSAIAAADTAKPSPEAPQ